MFNKDLVLALLSKYAILVFGMLLAYQALATYSTLVTSQSLFMLVIIVIFMLIFTVDLFFSFIPILQAYAKKRR